MTAMDTYQRTDPLVGAVLDGRYRMDSVIATGGMSTVYRGLDTRLDRPVAVKVMDARYSRDAAFLTRFQREARTVARLKGDGLVAVYDQGGGGPDGPPPYLVMELVDGGTLRELLRERGPMPPHAAAAVLAPICRGLAVAHAAGLVLPLVPATLKHELSVRKGGPSTIRSHHEILTMADCQLRAPKIAVPIRTWVVPSATAASRSSVIPIDRQSRLIPNC